jgi:hypothetical protein
MISHARYVAALLPLYEGEGVSELARDGSYASFAGSPLSGPGADVSA